VDAHITAVELKLGNWRKALRQADNLAFGADRSWVVLDESRAAIAVAAADQFRAFGVGLAIVGPDTGLQIVARPAGRRPERWLRALVAESAWSLAESEVAASAAGF
jgi:type IV secretory pathway TrbD component